jgi:hypothetical protein
LDPGSAKAIWTGPLATGRATPIDPIPSQLIMGSKNSTV